MRTEPTKIKPSVCVLSDSRLFGETTCAWLALQTGIRWAASARTLQQLRQRLDGRAADVLLAHARTAGALGTELLRDIRTLLPATSLIVLACCHNDQGLAQWVEAGASDYLLQSVSPGELLRCIRSAASDGPKCSVARHTLVLGGDRPVTMTRQSASAAGHAAVEPFCGNVPEIALDPSSGLMRQAILRQCRCAADRDRTHRF
jgi:DNA-binding NarL/FixJ family response regulator